MYIMQQIKNALVKEPPSYNIMLWAACCLAFFGFLRVGELTILAKGSYNKSSHLSLFDIAVDKRDYPQLLRITIRQLKTDPFCKGVKIFLGVTNRPVCPIVGITQYLAASHSHRGPLFVTSDRNELTRQTFTALLNPLLAKLHVNIKNYNTQFLDWSSHLCRRSPHPRLLHKDAGSLVQQCIPALYKDTTSIPGCTIYTLSYSLETLNTM